MSKVTIQLNDDEVEELLRIVRDMSISLSQQTEMLGILIDEQAERRDTH